MMRRRRLITAYFLGVMTFASCAYQEDSTTSTTRTSEPPIDNPREVITPTSVVRAFRTACKNRDIASIEQVISRGSYRFLEEHSKKENKTVAEVLSSCKSMDMPIGAFNEKVYSGTATVDVQNTTTKQYDRISFVTENGLWKIAADQFEVDLKLRVGEDLNKKDRYYDLEDNKVKNKYRIKVAQLEAGELNTLEQKKDQLIAKGSLDQQEYQEKVDLVKARYAAKRKVLDDAQAIRRGVFFQCLFY